MSRRAHKSIMNTGLVVSGPSVVTGEKRLRLQVLIIYEDIRTGLQGRQVVEEVASAA